MVRIDADEENKQTDVHSSFIFVSRSHALRGNAVLDALRRLTFPQPQPGGRGSVPDGIPTEDRGNENFVWASGPLAVDL